MTHVDDFRTVFFGPNRIIVTADVSFGGGLDTENIDAEITDIENQLQTVDDRVKKVYIEPEL